MNDVMQAVGVFFGYAVLAVFAQNAVFTRGLGVSRLVQLVGDERTYQLIDKMFAAVAECFGSKLVHIGMDEAHMVGLGRYLQQHG